MMHWTTTQSNAFRIGSTRRQEKISEVRVQSLLKRVRDDDSVRKLVFSNIDFHSFELSRSLEKLFVQDGRRFSCIKLIHCSGPQLPSLISTLLDQGSTKSLTLSHCQEPGAMEAIAEGLRTNQSLEILRISGATFLQEVSLEEGLTRNNTLHELDLSGSHISEHVVPRLAAALGSRNHGLKVLKLNDCDLEDDGVSRIVTSIIQNESVVRLELSHNIVSGASLEATAKLIEQNTTLKHLSLAALKPPHKANHGAHRRHLTRVIRVLATNTTMVSLDVSGNQLHEATVAEMAECLSMNASLEIFDASGCGLSEAGISAFVDRLPEYRSLRSLNLGENDSGFTPCAAEALVKALEHNRVLTDLGLTDDDEMENDAITSRIRHYLDLNRAGRKALKEDVALSLWPVLLARTPFADDCGRQANCLYSLLQGPALFEA